MQNTMADVFYLCGTLGCNRKYKKAATWLKHMHQQHGQQNPALPQPITLNKTQRSGQDRSNDRIRFEQEAQRKQEEAERRQKLQDQAKRKADEQFAKHHEEALRKANEKRFRLQQEELALQKEKQTLEAALLRQRVDAESALLKRVSENPNECCICMDRPTNATVVPCGHAFFCVVCLTEAQTNHRQRGCPFCRGPIEKVLRLYQ